jgi:hypothetical protein
MSEALGDHGGSFDDGDARQGATPRRAVFPVDIEHPDAAGLKRLRAGADDASP